MTNEELRKAVEVAAKEFDRILCGCPRDQYDWQNKKFESRVRATSLNCEACPFTKDYSKCWEDYLLERARKAVWRDKDFSKKPRK